MRKIKHLKIDQNSDWLAYQRGIPKDLKAKAKAMKLPLTIVRPLGLSKAASEAQITAAIEKHNRTFEDICRLIRGSSEGLLGKKQALESAKALLEARGVNQGSLVDIDPMHPSFDATVDAALGIHQHQDHYDWQRNFPDEERLPEDLVSAVRTLLNTTKGHEQVHLFSDAAVHYEQYRQQ